MKTLEEITRRYQAVIEDNPSGMWVLKFAGTEMTLDVFNVLVNDLVAAGFLVDEEAEPWTTEGRLIFPGLFVDEAESNSEEKALYLGIMSSFEGASGTEC